MVESCAEKTYAATTITDIVARARISRTTFYKHFDDKRACFDAAIDYCVEQLQEVAAAAHSTEDPPADAARKAAAAVSRRWPRKPGLAQLLTGDAMAVEPKVIERYRKATIPALEGALERDGDGADSPQRSPPRLRPGPGPDPQPDRHRQGRTACRTCCRRSSTWPSAPSADTRRRSSSPARGETEIRGAASR